MCPLRTHDLCRRAFRSVSALALAPADKGLVMCTGHIAMTKKHTPTRYNSMQQKKNTRDK